MSATPSSTSRRDRSRVDPVRRHWAYDPSRSTCIPINSMCTTVSLYKDQFSSATRKGMYVGDEGGKKLKMALACLLDQDGLLRREPDIVSPVYWLQSRDAVTELLYGFEWLTIQGTRAPFITIFAMKCIPERFGRQCGARNGPLPEDTQLHFYTTTRNRYHHVRAYCCSTILSLEQGQSQGAQLRRAIDFSKRNGIFSG